MSDATEETRGDEASHGDDEGNTLSAAAHNKRIAETRRGGIADAARLVRMGNPAEATAAIRRSIGGPPGDRQAAGQAAPSPGTTVPGTPGALQGPMQSSLRGRVSVGSAGTTGTPRTAPHASPSATGARGRFLDGSYTDASGTRHYKLYVPDGYQGQAVPLIVMLHGCSQGPDDFAAGTAMNALAEQHTFLAVYPTQPASANQGECWNWFRPRDQRRGSGEPALLAGLTHRVADEYHADPARIYVAGMSAGAAMAVILGATYPDLYAAVGAHSGLPYGAAHDLRGAFAAQQRGSGSQDAARQALLAFRAAGAHARVVPTLVFHGDRDTTVNPVNANEIVEQGIAVSAHGPDRTRRIDRQPVVTEGRIPGGRPYTLSIYRDGRGRAMLEKWIVRGAGHNWSGGDRSGSYTDPGGPNASADMVRFFAEHPQDPSPPTPLPVRGRGE